MKSLLLALKSVLILTAVIGVTSCSSTKSASGGQYAEYNGGPVNYGSDGAYKPYSGTQPRQAPAATSGGYQEFNQPPANAHKATYQPQTAKSSSKTSSTKKKTVASTSPSKSTSKTGSSKTAKSAPKTQNHVVRHGDTLWGLAKKYHTTVPAIKKANHLTSDVLRDGTSIKIP